MNIKGLTIIRNAIPDHKNILEKIDQFEWSNVLKRRTQHYGAIYNYQSRSLSFTCPKIESNEVINDLSKRLSLLCNMDNNFTQCIINEYKKKQSISPHIDAFIFGSIIAIVTLGDAGILIFEKGDSSVEIEVKPGDVMILKDDARYKYKHSTKPFSNSGYRRVSATFRTF